MNKQDELIDLLKSYKSVVVAFSGGVDSSVLAKAAYVALGENAVAITAKSELMTEQEIIDAQNVASLIGIKHHFFTVDDLGDEKFTANDKMRCYHCHINRFKILEDFCHQHNFNYLLEGSNEDDKGDYRPGMLALKEFPITKSPFLTLHITKNEIRQMAKNWNLPVWNKPSSACLASRVAYGLEITPERLQQIDEAEQLLKNIVQGQIRVRHHGNLARIEVEADAISQLFLPKNRELITTKLQELGFTFITIDLNGYQKGSTNAALDLSSNSTII